MYRITRITCTLALALFVSVAADAQQSQSPDPDSPRYKGVVALQDFLAGSGPESLQAFIDDRIAASVRESMSDEDLIEALEGLRTEAAGASPDGAMPIGRLSAEIVLSGGEGGDFNVSFELDSGDNDRFTKITSPHHKVG